MSIENCTDEELIVLKDAILFYDSKTAPYSEVERICQAWFDAIEQEIKDRNFEKTKQP